jgi:multidrug efflux pump subunit AcrA (membrane-fusion protein)
VGELRVLQTSLDAVRRELSTVKHELLHCEQRLRYEMKLELEARMRVHDERCVEKVTYMRRRADLHVGQVRAAQRTRHETSKMQHTKQVQQLEGALAALTQHSRQAQTDQARAEAALEQTKQLERLSEENVSLHERLGEAQAQAAQAEAQAQTQKQEAVARLEAALAARDKTIEVLRQQLVQARKGAPPGSSEQPGVA